jgi:hypothetical protein
MINLTELKKAAEAAGVYEMRIHGDDLLNLIAVVEAAEDTPAKFQTTAMRVALKELEK